jgi:hypothetical protein
MSVREEKKLPQSLKTIREGGGGYVILLRASKALQGNEDL